ncbi:exodeoxyribonuclease VII large subunit [Treponema sp.]|uniref:exodeoxyribonuclease VII large subunit n=1 Tax=Treponema sp. TaxID=166 RepID=UPI00257E2C7E|nr:exodeoxyribonuclease VII large subunit [Treponema sp.]MBE6354619.1 exodeoxyribonuclease VII large subunit [Treponema sp.]
MEQENNILTVTQLTNLIKTLLEGSFSSVTLMGEISNYRPSGQGHLYFYLKDADSVISAVMFRGNAASLKFTPKDGMVVQVRGRISVYNQRGNYQIIITSMEKAGTGAIMEMLEMRKQKLAAEGLFDSKNKKKLPFFPDTVGVITGANTAALRDILNVISRRNPKVNITILPAIVQGEDAAPTVIRQIRTANAYKMCDTLIIARGGGSLEDLLPFSDENVVREAAASDIPIISAIGHDTDWSLCDFACDVRAPTPSAAAELAVPVLTEFTETIEWYKNDFIHKITDSLSRLRLTLRTFTPQNLELYFRNIELPYLNRFDDAVRSLKDSMQRIVEEKKQTVAKCIQDLENCNPQTIFDRGYSMVTTADGKILRDASTLKSGEILTIRPAKGSIQTKVL